MDLLNQNRPFFLILSARPSSGKSHLIEYLMLLNNPEYNKNPFEYGLVLTGTSFNGQYNKFIPADFIHSSLDLSVIDNLMAIQASQMEATGSAPRAFIILDDCLSQKAFSSQTFINLSTQFRHFNISILIATQYIYKVPPVFRESATHAAIFKQTTMRSITALFESYGSAFNNVKEFSKYITNNLGDYRFCLYYSNSSEEDIKKLYPIFKAPDSLPEFNYSYG
jgi:hypothetical protein